MELAKHLMISEPNWRKLRMVKSYYGLRRLNDALTFLMDEASKHNPDMRRLVN